MKQGDKIYLIGNYAPDKQESMNRFATMMQELYRKEGYEVAILEPLVVFGRLVTRLPNVVQKYIGYVDKFLVFPLLLLAIRLGQQGASYHVCDHSNALYMAVLPSDRAVIVRPVHLACCCKGLFFSFWCEARSWLRFPRLHWTS
jgi:hypothetical protein